MRLMNTVITSPDQAIEELKQHWNQLCDLERAQAIARIRTAKVSVRKIVRQLGKSESSFRRQQTVLKAPAADLAAARGGNIRTNELIRRVKAEAARKAANRDKDLKRKREEQTLKGTKLVCEWPQQTKLERSSCEEILADARFQIALAEFNGTLPKPRDSAGHSNSEIIQRCRPRDPVDDQICHIGWFGLWLARWSLDVFPDSNIRDEVFRKAEKTQIHR